MTIVSTKQEYLLGYLSRFDAKNIPVIMEGLFLPRDFHGIMSEKNLIASAIRADDYLNTQFIGKSTRYPLVRPRELR